MMTYPNSYGMNRQMYGNGNLRIRPVTSLEEVRASAIDFDGSIFYFHDVANKKVYTKQINLDGMVQIDAYELAAAPVQPAEELDPANYVTKDEFQIVIQELLDFLKGGKHYESTSNDTKFDF